MSKIDDGGPAFPNQINAVNDVVFAEVMVGGMSLRDYFAGQSLAGQRASNKGLRTIIGRIRNMLGLSTAIYLSTPESVAKCAYADADAMLQQRKEQPCERP